MDMNTMATNSAPDADDAYRASRAVVECLFSKTDNPNHFTQHHLESFDFFFSSQLYSIFKNAQPILYTSTDTVAINNSQTSVPRQKCSLYLGGKNGDRIRFSKPVIFDENVVQNAEGRAGGAEGIGAEGTETTHKHYMTPNEARLRNMNYAMPIHYDIECELEYLLAPGQEPYTQIGDLSIQDFGIPAATLAQAQKTGRNKKNQPVAAQIQAFSPDIIQQLEESLSEKGRIIQPIPGSAYRVQMVRLLLTELHLGTFPIMVQSRFCILSALTSTERFQMGECRNDMGGYFIIEGKEKAIIPQEQFANNVLYVKESTNDADKYSFKASVRSVSENVNKPIRTFSIEYMKPTKTNPNGQIMVNIPNVLIPIPVFILFRALGVLSDRDILRYCALNVNADLEIYRPSVHDGRIVYTQHEALQYIALYTRFKKVHHVMHILADFVLAHIGELDFRAKAHYLGYMCRQLVNTVKKIIPPTDRDHFKFKRVQTPGSMILGLFQEYFEIYNKNIFQGFERILNYNRNMYNLNLVHLIVDNHREIVSNKIIHDGFVKAFKGNWGAHSHTKQVGVVQDLNRLSFNGYLAHLRKTSITLDSTSKIVGPRLLHCTQQYYFDPLDTPDGGNIGIHKYMSVSTQISRGYPRTELIQWLLHNTDLILMEDCEPELVLARTRVFINGFISGCVTKPMQVTENIRFARRLNCLPIHTSVSFYYSANEIHIYTDEGRVIRPVFYRIQDNKNKPVMSNILIVQRLKRKEPITWNECIYGVDSTIKDSSTKTTDKVRSLRDVHGLDINDIRKLTADQRRQLMKKQALIDLIDPNESESALIATKGSDLAKSNYYTHMEIHESFMFGIMVNQVMFPEFNPPVRNLFSCGQTKQAVSMYSTNYPVRMDKMAVVMNYAETPLVKTDYLKYTCNEENMYGHNALVAIGCYTSYNVEDAVLINEASIQRGLFATTYYSTYSSHESKDKIVTSVFGNVGSDESVTHKNGKYKYEFLDDMGIIRVGTKLTDKHILIGQSTGIIGETERKDVSKKPKKEQLGTVDRTIVFGKEGERTAKVRVAELRMPAMGDKMASRAGQKGTIGLIVPEKDMPFLSSGQRPDIIVNPHAIPSRMTVCHLLEALFGSVAVQYGTFCNSTGFHNEGKCLQDVGKLMQSAGLHSAGNEVMYNGMTGEQMEMSMFVGPTYYMRLKHMVKDKMNYRAEGPNDQLTRQPVSGRASDGGLRMGEMERDVLIAYGMESFTHDSYMTRADSFYLAICNTTGNLFVYNPGLNRMFSPSADGPIEFCKNLVTDEYEPRTLTHYNHSFSIVEVPYSFKLLMQEVQIAGVQMRIITEDNLANILTKTDVARSRLQDKTESANRIESVEDKVDATLSFMDKYIQTTQVPEQAITGPTLKDGYAIYATRKSQNDQEEQGTLMGPYQWEHVAPIVVEPTGHEGQEEKDGYEEKEEKDGQEKVARPNKITFSDVLDVAPTDVIEIGSDSEDEQVGYANNEEDEDDEENPTLIIGDRVDDDLQIEMGDSRMPKGPRDDAKTNAVLPSAPQKKVSATDVDDILDIQRMDVDKKGQDNPAEKTKKRATKPKTAKLPKPVKEKVVKPPKEPKEPKVKQPKAVKEPKEPKEKAVKAVKEPKEPKTRKLPKPVPTDPPAGSPKENAPVVVEKPKKKAAAPKKDKSDKGRPEVRPMVGDLVTRLNNEINGELFFVMDICKNDDTGNCWVTLQKYDILNKQPMSNVPPVVASVGDLELFQRKAFVPTATTSLFGTAGIGGDSAPNVQLNINTVPGPPMTTSGTGTAATAAATTAAMNADSTNAAAGQDGKGPRAIKTTGAPAGVKAPLAISMIGKDDPVS